MTNPSPNPGQRAFFAIERVFNIFFGERLNPFYHLGAIAYFLFWVVTVSYTHLTLPTKRIV